MDVRILGCSGTYPSPHCPASGYLVSGEEARVWIDCGTGTFAALQDVLEFTTVDALVITHLHSDHCLDIYPFYYALRLHPDRPWGVPVYAPPGSREHLARLIAGDSVAVFSEVFDFRSIGPGERLEIGDLSLDFALSDHPIPTYGVSVACGDHRLVYSADTGPRGDILDLARGADSFICEATYQNGHTSPPLHLSAAEAGELAKRAEVGALFLTHLLPELEHEQSALEASQTWGGDPVVLDAGMVLRTDGREIETI